MAFTFGSTPQSGGVSVSMSDQLNRVCQAYNKEYRAMMVSWNDNSRTQGSVWGSNITDARLKGKDGEDFLVVRPSNFNERIGKVKARDLAMIVGNHTQKSGSSTLTPTTLDDFLKSFGTYASYCSSEPLLHTINLSTTSALFAEPEQVGIRFQAVFLPVKDPSSSPFSTEKDCIKEFYPDTYNYQTRSWDDPKNVIVLCTSQGSFVQQDGPGSVPQHLHQFDFSRQDWRNHYLEASMTKHGVSMGQVETEAERKEALDAGKAVSTVIGTRSMGQGFNRLMTIQIPLKQKAPAPAPFGFGSGSPAPAPFGSPAPAPAPFGSSTPAPGLFGSSLSAPPTSFGAAVPFAASAVPPSSGFGSSVASATSSGVPFGAALLPPAPPVKAKAARVSYGTDAGPLRRMNLGPGRLVRDETCAITVTVQFYFVVPEGRPIDEADIRKAVDVCEEAYKGCNWVGHLMDKVPETAPLKDHTEPQTTMIGTGVFPTPFGAPGPPGFRSLTIEKWEESLFDSSTLVQMRQLPANQHSFNWLHNDIAISLLNSRKDLDKAFCAFQKANKLHLLYTGVPSDSALYNMACCLSVAAQEHYQKASLIAPHLPPNPAMEQDQPNSNYPASFVLVHDLIEKRLDAAAQWLLQAAVAGYSQKSHMQTDKDLEFLRLRRPDHFAKALSLM